MRIYHPSTISWLLYCPGALLAAGVDATNVVTFDTTYFKGFDNTSVLLHPEDGGYMFVWTPSRRYSGPAVRSLVLAQVDGAAIVTVENSQQPPPSGNSNNLLDGQSSLVSVKIRHHNDDTTTTTPPPLLLPSSKRKLYTHNLHSTIHMSSRLGRWLRDPPPQLHPEQPDLVRG